MQGEKICDSLIVIIHYVQTANRRMIAPTKRIKTQDLWKQACRNGDDVFCRPWKHGTYIPAKIIAHLGPETLMAESVALGTAFRPTLTSALKNPNPDFMVTPLSDAKYIRNGTQTQLHYNTNSDLSMPY